jgi:hypothetical protein
VRGGESERDGGYPRTSRPSNSHMCSGASGLARQPVWSSCHRTTYWSCWSDEQRDAAEWIADISAQATTRTDVHAVISTQEASGLPPRCDLIEREEVDTPVRTRTFEESVE